MTDSGYSLDNPVPPKHALNITVPGAVAGWLDTIEKHGSGKVCVVCVCVFKLLYMYVHVYVRMCLCLFIHAYTSIHTQYQNVINFYCLYYSLVVS